MALIWQAGKRIVLRRVQRIFALGLELVRWFPPDEGSPLLPQSRHTALSKAGID